MPVKFRINLPTTCLHGLELVGKPERRLLPGNGFWVIRVWPPREYRRLRLYLDPNRYGNNFVQKSHTFRLQYVVAIDEKAVAFMCECLLLDPAGQR